MTDETEIIDLTEGEKKSLGVQIAGNSLIIEGNGVPFPVQILTEDLMPRMKKSLIVLPAIPACII